MKHAILKWTFPLLTIHSSRVNAASLTGLKVTDQKGELRDFEREVLGGRPVIVNFVYTRCEGVCPGQGENFARLQKTLGDRLGRDVRLVSVSIDPERDTPEKLRPWAKHYQAGEHWTLVTSSRADLDRITQNILGMTSPGANIPLLLLCVANPENGKDYTDFRLPKRSLKLLITDKS